MDIKKKLSIKALALTISLGGLALTLPNCSNSPQVSKNKNHKKSS